MSILGQLFSAGSQASRAIGVARGGRFRREIETKKRERRKRLREFTQASARAQGARTLSAALAGVALSRSVVEQRIGQFKTALTSQNVSQATSTATKATTSLADLYGTVVTGPAAAQAVPVVPTAGGAAGAATGAVLATEAGAEIGAAGGGAGASAGGAAAGSLASIGSAVIGAAVSGYYTYKNIKETSEQVKAIERGAETQLRGIESATQRQNLSNRRGIAANVARPTSAASVRTFTRRAQDAPQRRGRAIAAPRIGRGQQDQRVVGNRQGAPQNRRQRLY